MKVFKWVGVVVAGYAGFVLAFETLYLGWYQPEFESSGIPMLVITTTDDSGVSRARRLARLKCSRSPVSTRRRRAGRVPADSCK